MAKLAASLREMTGRTSSIINRLTLDKAASALVDQEKVIAELAPKKNELEALQQQFAKLQKQLKELQKQLKEVSFAAAEADDLTLVASGGEEIMVKACLARSASPYFATALVPGFMEAEEKKIKFKDVGIAVLRFIASSIHAGEAGADLVALPTPHNAGFVEQIIDFSASRLMPWIAKAAVRQVLETNDAAVLVNLLHVAEGHVQGAEGHVQGGADDLQEPWKELSLAATQRLADKIEEAVKVEALSLLPLEVLQRILVLVDGAPWPEWHDLAVVAEGAGETSSPPTREGLVLKVIKHSNGTVDAFVCRFKDASGSVVIGRREIGEMEFEVEAVSSVEGVASKKRAGSAVFHNSGKGWRQILRPGKRRQRFVHGDSYKFRFRARHTKLHRKCQVLLQCVKTHLPPQAQGGLLIVSALELLGSNKGLEGLRAMLVEFLAGMLRRIDADVACQLSCGDLEAIITHPNLDTETEGEISVLKAVVCWAQSCDRLSPSVGAAVRVRDDSKHEKWRGAECIIVNKTVKTGTLPIDGNAACAWEIKTSDPGMGVLSVEGSDLLLPGHLGLEKLLQHVRFPFIQRGEILSWLDEQELALAHKSPAFERGWQEAVEVQLGKRKAEELGERGQKRARCKKGDAIPQLDSSAVAKALLGR